MRKLFLLIMVLLPCTAFAATECRIVEYPDHYEATCTGDPSPPSAASRPVKQAVSPASHQAAGKDQAPVQEQVLASAPTPDPETPDVPPESIVRNNLARLHGEYWLKTR